MNTDKIQIRAIEDKIFLLRGHKVMLDVHLAQLYGEETKALKRAVKRNLDRFPHDFMFELTREEYNSLRSQFGTLEEGRGKYAKYVPFAFTENGIAMLSSVLRSKTAIEVFDRLQKLEDAPEKSVPVKGFGQQT